jgi:hypothetical protein
VEINLKNFLCVRALLNLVSLDFFSLKIDTRTLEELDEVLRYTSQTKSSFTRVMLDKMVVPLPNGDVDVSMLKDAAEMISGRFETEVALAISYALFPYSICGILV